MSFVTSVDVINRGLQHLGATLIASLTDNSKNQVQASFVYDKCRRAELRANLWNFSARRVILRPYVFGSSQVWVPQAWNILTTYAQGAVVSFAGQNWVNANDTNLGLTPGSGAPYIGWQELFAPIIMNAYVAGTVYYPGEIYYAPAGVLSPPGVFLVGPSATYIVPVLSQAPYHIFTPMGRTTGSLQAAKPAYPLPYAYLRVMPQDPKTAGTPAQLSTAGMQSADYEFENGFLLTNSAQGGPLAFRFSADVQTVAWFDDMFAEALACRIAIELCETLTQSPQKLQGVKGLYDEAILKAIRINAIEAGSTEPDPQNVDTQRGPTREKAMPQPRQQQ